MAPEELRITSEELIQRELAKEMKDVQRWYGGEGSNFLDATDGGRLAFTWEATYSDGVKLRQYDDITFFRALADNTFIPSLDRLISTDKIDRSKVREFVLLPIAYTLSKCPRIGRSFRVVIYPEQGQKLVANWCTDVNMTTGKVVRRHVIGMEQEDSKTLFIISPSGTMVLAASDDVSFEGE